MTYRETEVETTGSEVQEAPRETAGVHDPVRRYLTEAARTPLLDKDDERRLAFRMARRRAMFQNAVAGIPSVWGPMAKLVRSALAGTTPPSKVFALGGASESAFHRHLKVAATLITRLDEIRRELCGEKGCRGHQNDRDLLREGKELAVALKIRISPLRRLLGEAKMELPAKKACVDCACRIGDARALFAAFVETRNVLVSANLRLVVHVAKQVARHPSQLLDLIQEGNVGLLYATEKYDAREVCQFHSYAFWWIKQSMTRAIAGKTRLVRQPVNLADASAPVRDEVKKFRSAEGRDPTSEELAGRLDLTRHQAQRLFRTAVRTYSLDQMASNAEGDGSPADRLPDPQVAGPNLDLDFVSGGLGEVLATLTPREREVVALRFGLGHNHNYTLENIARIYNLSRERVRQIEIKALGKLREPTRMKRLRELLDALED